MSNQKPLVTFGFVNCNRLFYLKSCVESLVECVSDYPNTEFIVVDNASIEDGTEDYLSELEERGFKVFRQEERDPSNEFAKGLNLIVENAKGDYVCPLQGDMQFVLKGRWLNEYVEFFEANKSFVSCIMFDAQRNVRLRDNSKFILTEVSRDKKFKILLDQKRTPVLGAADVMYSKEILEVLYPWATVNQNHEGGNDSETKMLTKFKSYLEATGKTYFCAMPQYPPAAAIYTDARGTMARIRGNKRYGDYWEAKENNKYYRIFETDSFLSLAADNRIYGIEDVAKPIGWPTPVDSNGNWLKNPINPSTALPSEFVVLGDELANQEQDDELSEEESFLDEWLGS